MFIITICFIRKRPGKIFIFNICFQNFDMSNIFFRYGTKQFINMEYHLYFLLIIYIFFHYLHFYIVSLRCNVDVQCSDGRSILLRYVTSYVTKLRDHEFIHSEHSFYMWSITVFCIKITLFCIKITHTLLMIQKDYHKKKKKKFCNACKIKKPYTVKIFY